MTSSGIVRRTEVDPASLSVKKDEPRHEISNNVVCATSKASDQPGHSRLNILFLLDY